MVFPVVMYGCESWTVKKAEHWRIAAFELWCWRRLLRVPWTARRSNQSILKEISLGCSLEGLMLKLKLQYFGHMMQRANSMEKTWLTGRDPGMLGKIEGRRRRGWLRWWDNIIDSMDLSLSKLREMMKDREAWRATVCGVTNSQTWLSDWTTTISAADTCLSFTTVLHLKYFSMFGENKNLGGRPPLTEEQVVQILTLPTPNT